jgi:hypothetical protein
MASSRSVLLNDAAGCRYQAARTLLLAGNGHAATGTAALTDLGLAPGSG